MELVKLLVKFVRDDILIPSGLPKKKATEVASTSYKIIVQSLVSDTSPYKDEYGTYERMEHAGDRLFNSIVSTFIFDKFPDATPRQLTEINSFYISLKSQTVIFDSVGISEYYLMFEDKNIAKKWKGRIPMTIKSDVLESLFYAIYLSVEEVFAGSGFSVCRNFLATHLSKVKLSPYRKNNGWRALLNQNIGKSMGGDKDNGKARYSINSKYDKGTYNAIITLGDESIQDIANHSIDRERFMGIKPVKFTASGEKLSLVKDDLYEMLFNYIVENVGFQFLLNDRRQKTFMSILSGDRNKNIRDYFTTNNLFPQPKVLDKATSGNTFVVEISYNSDYPKPPPGMNKVLSIDKDSNPEYHRTTSIIVIDVPENKMSDTDSQLTNEKNYVKRQGLIMFYKSISKKD